MSDQRAKLTPIAEVVRDIATELPSKDEAARRWNDWLEKRLAPDSIDLALRGYRVPTRFRRLTVDEKLLPAECREWVDRAPNGASMILAGPPGTGKTTAAVWCLREHYIARSRAGDATPQALLVKTRDLYQAVFDKKAEKIKQVEKCDALVIDDWGTAYEHEWPLSELEAVIDRRWDECRPTIVTTNMNPDGGAASLKERLPRSFDRLTGDPGPGVVIIDRPSLRQQVPHGG